jgi:ribosomal protein L34E
VVALKMVQISFERTTGANLSLKTQKKKKNSVACSTARFPLRGLADS